MTRSEEYDHTVVSASAPLATLINSLPGELFLDILLRVLHVSCPRIDYLRRLAWVSKGWKKFIEGNSSLWTVIQLADSVDSVRMAVRKSEGLPLVIRCDIPTKQEATDYGAKSPEDYLSGFEELCGHIHRWKSCSANLSLFASTSYPDYLKLLEQSAPLLHTFNIIGISSIRINLFGGNAPRLRELCLDLVPVPWRSAVLSGLERLSIHFLKWGPSYGDLLTILQKCPLLKYLSLSQIYIHHEWGGVDEKTVVNLHELEELRIWSLHASEAMPLLQRLVTPKCRKFTFDVVHAEQVPDETITTEVFERPAMANILPETRWIDIRILPGSFVIEGRQDDSEGSAILSLGLSGARLDADRLFHSLYGLWQEHLKGTPSRLFYQPVQNSATAVDTATLHYMHGLSRIIELELQRSPAFGSLLEALVTPNPEVEGGILFPNLASLRIHDCFCPDMILEWIRFRMRTMPGSQTLSPANVTFVGVTADEAESEAMDRLKVMLEENGGTLKILDIYVCSSHNDDPESGTDTEAEAETEAKVEAELEPHQIEE